MSEKSPYSTPAVKTIARQLTPTFFWNIFQRRFGHAPEGDAGTNGNTGKERRSDFYDAMYLQTEDYCRHYTHSRYYFLWCVILDRMRPTEVRALLDIGCGPGQFASLLRDRGLQKYVGIDFSNVCIRMARLACTSAQFECSDVFSSDLFDTLDYDVAVATEFLEHIEGDLVILGRIRPGTRVYGSVPNFPDPSHVRYFNSVEDVYARYSSSFESFRVDELLFGSEGMSFFLFEGIRCSK